MEGKTPEAILNNSRVRQDGENVSANLMLDQFKLQRRGSLDSIENVNATISYSIDNYSVTVWGRNLIFRGAGGECLLKF